MLGGKRAENLELVSPAAGRAQAEGHGFVGQLSSTVEQFMGRRPRGAGITAWSTRWVGLAQ